MANQDKCRHCGARIEQTLVDLGSSPLCNTLLSEDRLEAAESFYPLHTRVCGNCFLVQVGEFVSPEEIFSEYSYFSSFSASFVEHARLFVESAVDRFALNPDSLVMEIASNDGYLLQHFLPHDIPVLGIEPAENVAEAARERGVRSVCRFLGSDSALELTAEYGHADLVVANNVIAHTPFLNDFVLGISRLLKPDGVVSIEFPQLSRMLSDSLYDMIYHEHFSYFSLYSIEKVLASQGLTVFDAEKIDTHGGSLRVSACASERPRDPTERLLEVRSEESQDGISVLETYSHFRPRVEKTKRDLLRTLISLREQGKDIVGYGVPGKGNTLLNYCGIRSDFLTYMVDRNPYKQGKYTLGTRIPIFPVEKIAETKPDFILIMPWNLKDEIAEQLSYTRDWGCQFIVPLPNVEVIE